MAVPKILLFYCFTPLGDPEAIRLWQRDLAESLGLGGRILISKFIPGAGEEALAFLERGDYFGEMALIDQAPRSAQARAHDEGAVVLAIPGEVVNGLLDVNKVSSLPLLKILCGLVTKRLRELDDKIVGWYILSGGEGASSI